jgi:hypothetical protein
MKNREELRQKGHDRSRKMMCHKRGKTSFSDKGDKYRSPIKI